MEARNEEAAAVIGLGARQKTIVEGKKKVLTPGGWIFYSYEAVEIWSLFEMKKPALVN